VPRLSPTAVRVLAEIHVAGVWMWSAPKGQYPGAAYLDNARRAPLRVSTVALLLRDGYLVPSIGPEEDDAVTLSAAGLEFLRTQPEAVGRAEARHVAQEAIYSVSAKAPAKPEMLRQGRE